MTNVFLCAGLRTPFGRRGGVLAQVRCDDLAALALAGVLRTVPQLDPGSIDEVMLGCANQAGEDNRNVARMALLLAGLPPSVPGVTVNRLCASGLEAIGQGARMIACGEADLVLAGGVESMTRAPLVVSKSRGAWDREQQALRFDARLALRQPDHEGALRHRQHGRDGGESRARGGHLPRGPGCLRVSKPAAGGARAG